MADVLIVAIIFSFIFGTGMIKVVLDHRKEVKKLEMSKQNQRSQDENEDLTKQIQELKQRVEVLERIVTDNKYQLDKEIASL